jgi:general secretion pathway protein B
MEAGAPMKPPREKVVSPGSDGTSDLHDLPAAIRNEVPRLSFSFLVYSTRPEERMVTINGKRMREGDEVSSGLKLEEITPDGAILSWKGKRFHKGVF